MKKSWMWIAVAVAVLRGVVSAAGLPVESAQACGRGGGVVTETFFGEAKLDPSLGDADIDVCLEQTVQDAGDSYAVFAADCASRDGQAASDPSELTTNLVTFNEVTLLCTLEVRATCTLPRHRRPFSVASR